MIPLLRRSSAYQVRHLVLAARAFLSPLLARTNGQREVAKNFGQGWLKERTSRAWSEEKRGHSFKVMFLPFIRCALLGTRFGSKPTLLGYLADKTYNSKNKHPLIFIWLLKTETCAIYCVKNAGKKCLLYKNKHTNRTNPKDSYTRTCMLSLSYKL